MLKTRLIAFLVAACLALPAAASAPPARPAASPPVPLMWRVCDSDNCLYLLGSMHVLYAGDYPLAAEVDDAFARARTVVFEVPPEQTEPQTLAAQMLPFIMNREGNRPLPAHVASKLDARGMGSLKTVRPWVLAMMVGMANMGKLGMQAEHGLDNHLAQRARQAGKATAGLESTREQLQALDGMSWEEQVQMLEEALSEGEDMGQAQRIHAAWRCGDADGLYREAVVPMRRDYPGAYRRINTERNLRWLPPLQRQLKEPGDALVVVGAMHLVGEDSVVEGLRARGYRIERIGRACAATEGEAEAETVPAAANPSPRG